MQKYLFLTQLTKMAETKQKAVFTSIKDSFFDDPFFKVILKLNLTLAQRFYAHAQQGAIGGYSRNMMKLCH